MIKERQEIAECDKWDLNDYFKNDDIFKEEFEDLKNEINSLEIFKGKLNNQELIINCLSLQENLNKRLENLYVYANLKTKEDSINSFYQERLTQVESLLSKFSASTSFIDVEMKKNKNELLINLQNTTDYSNYFKNILRQKKHILSEKEEKILALTGEVINGFSNNFFLFDNADIKFPDVLDANGEKHNLNHSTYLELMESNDRKLRENTLKAFNGEYGKYNNFLASNYISNIKADSFYAKVSKYKSCIDKALYLEEVDKNVYKKLIEYVNKNLKEFYGYFELKRKSQGFENFAIYDQYIKEKNINKKYTFDEAIEIIKSATKVLGEEYINLIDKAVKERWIDKYPNKNKENGAFSWGAYRKKPVLLMNFIGDTHSLFTLAHELGHSIHSYYSNQNQKYCQAGYTIFIAEIASTVNEMLLIKYLLNKTEDRNEKIFYIDYFLSNFKATILRQTMFSEFEYFAHDTFEKGEPISAEVLNNFYYNLNKKYFGDDVVLIDEIKFEWSRIPHFYNDFYVYKYATGMISAIYFVDNIIPNNYVNYINLLKSGSTKDPISLLLDAGVNLKDKKTFDYAFNKAKTMIELWNSLL